MIGDEIHQKFGVRVGCSTLSASREMIGRGGQEGGSSTRQVLNAVSVERNDRDGVVSGDAVKFTCSTLSASREMIGRSFRLLSC